MAAKRGRKSKYDECVKPYIADIKKAVESGATLDEIAVALGISKSTLCTYKNEKKELSDAFARGRAYIVFDIKAALLKKALGYDYEEEKRVGRKDKEGENIVLVEKYKRHQPPSETAAAMLLRNYDENWLDKDNVSTQLRQQELNLKKAVAKANNFDLDLNFDKGV